MSHDSPECPPISLHDDPQRVSARREFISRQGLGNVRLVPLAPDASFRCYFRIADNDRTYMLMDAPPPNEDVRPFMTVDKHLRSLGLIAPKIIDSDVDNGFLLLEDFGDNTFTRLLDNNENADRLYTLAVDTLIVLHSQGNASLIDRPNYDTKALLTEALLLPDWHYPLVFGKTIDTTERDAYMEIWRNIIDTMPPPEMTLVLRDFHVDNLMLIDHDGKQECALLDFQDAMIGPIAYDLASLLEDARRDMEPEFRQRYINYYLKGMPKLEKDNFTNWYSLLAAQRHAKVIGIFSRLYLRDGKRRYLKHLPRVFRLLESHFDHPALAKLTNWMNRVFPDRHKFNPDSITGNAS